MLLTNSLTGGAVSAVHEGVEVVWSVPGRVQVPDTAAVAPLVASVALTEAPLTVSCEGTATKALVVVIIMVVVVRVPAQSSQKQSVLEISVVNPHGGHGTRSPQSGPSQEASSDTEPEGLLREALPSVFPDSSLEVGPEVCSITRGLEAARLRPTKTAAVAGSLGVNKPSTANGSFRFDASTRTSTRPLLLGIVGFASRSE